MDKDYNSVYGLHIKQFIVTKRALGFKYTTGALILNQIDQLAEQREETSSGITKKTIFTTLFSLRLYIFF